MKLILKILVLPVAGILSITTAFCSFALAISDMILGIVSVIVFLLALITVFTLDRTMGVVWLTIAYLISPFGLPKLAGWVIEKMDSINSMLKSFIFR